MRKLVPVLLLALLGACSSDLVQPPQQSDGFTTVDAPAMSLTGCNPIGFNNFAAHYPCDAVVRIYAPSGWADDVLAAAQQWEEALAPMGITFSTTTGTESLTLSVVDYRHLGGGGSVVYCGEGNDGGMTLYIWYSGNSLKPSYCLQTTPHPVLVHEMNHALGFNSWSKKPWTTDCVAHRDGNIYNESPCLYEMERMLAGYDLREPFHLLKALVVDFSISPTILTLDPTDQAVLTPGRHCSPYNISMTYCPSELTYQWSSDDPSVATVTPSSNTRSATITAVSPGTAQISVSLVGPDSLIASGLAGGGPLPAPMAPRTVNVTVTAPPPPVPFQATISGTTVIQPNTLCYAYAGISGGQAPHTLSWSTTGKGGYIVSTYYDVAEVFVGNNPVTVNLLVTDAVGDTAQATTIITPSSSGPAACI